MATHAEAVSGSALLGQTVVKIDYTNYQLELDSSELIAFPCHMGREWPGRLVPPNPGDE